MPKIIDYTELVDIYIDIHDNKNEFWKELPFNDGEKCSIMLFAIWLNKNEYRDNDGN